MPSGRTDGAGVERALALLFGSPTPTNMPRALRTAENGVEQLRDRDIRGDWVSSQVHPVHLPWGLHAAFVGPKIDSSNGCTSQDSVTLP